MVDLDAFLAAELSVQVSDQLLNSVHAGVDCCGCGLAYDFCHFTRFCAQLSQDLVDVALDHLETVGSASFFDELFEQIFHMGHIDLFKGVVLFEQRELFGLVILFVALVARATAVKLG
ncbi:hypothetical protein D3C87_1392430 [compost metagenome]